jgi:hypothetical protein
VISQLGTAGVGRGDGDANGARVVNFTDLLALAKNYNKAGATTEQGDFNGDGQTNFTDLLILAKHYNKGGRADLNRDNVVDQADLNLLDATLGKALPSPPAGSTTAAAAPAPTPAGTCRPDSRRRSRA